MSFYVVIDPRNNEQLVIDPVSGYEDGTLGKNDNYLYIEIDKCNPQTDVFDYVDGKLKKKSKKVVDAENIGYVLSIKLQDLKKIYSRFIYNRYSVESQNNLNREATILFMKSIDPNVNLTDEEKAIIESHKTMNAYINEIRARYQGVKARIAELDIDELRAFDGLDVENLGVI